MPTIPDNFQAQMSKLLEQELRACKQLEQLLAAEQQSVTARNIPAFEKIIGKKQLMLERVAQYEKQRILLLEDCGIKNGAESMDDFLKSRHDNDKLSELWQQLLSMAANCRNHNRRNHQLVELCSAHTRKALCILRGEPMDQNVYGPNGDTSDPHGNRSLAIA